MLVSENLSLGMGSRMAGFLDAIKGKSDGRFGTPAVELSGPGGNSGNMAGDPSDGKGRNFLAAESSAANYARERAAAAKAQIEARKAMEESRKTKDDRKSENSGITPIKPIVEETPAPSQRAVTQNTPAAPAGRVSSSAIRPSGFDGP